MNLLESHRFCAAKRTLTELNPSLEETVIGMLQDQKSYPHDKVLFCCYSPNEILLIIMMIIMIRHESVFLFHTCSIFFQYILFLNRRTVAQETNRCLGITKILRSWWSTRWSTSLAAAATITVRVCSPMYVWETRTYYGWCRKMSPFQNKTCIFLQYLLYHIVINYCNYSTESGSFKFQCFVSHCFCCLFYD